MIEEVKDDSLVDRKKKKVKKSKEKKMESNQENEEDGLVEPKKKAKKRKKSETTEELTQLEDNGEVKKEKKSKFKISLNPDGCEPPAPVKAKKPFWRPNKGPKILIASGENEETAAKRKKKEKDKKRLKKKGEEAQVHETQGHNKAVRYLTSWAEDRQNWKFEKCRQIWLVQNCYDPMKIPDAIFPTLVEYMNSIRGKMREVALERAKDKMEKGQKQLELIEAGKAAEEKKEDESSEEVPKKKKKEKKKKEQKSSEAEEVSEELIDAGTAEEEKKGDESSVEVPKKEKKKKEQKTSEAKNEQLIPEAELKRATQIVEMLLE